MNRDSLKQEAIGDINELLGDRLSVTTEISLKKLTLIELYRILVELKEEKR